MKLKDAKIRYSIIQKHYKGESHMPKTKKFDYIISSHEFLTVDLIDRIEEARESTEILAIGVISDELFCEKMGRSPIRKYEERAKILSHIRGVDFVFKVRDEDEIEVKKEMFYYDESSQKRYHIGYAPGTYDLLHEGHIEHLLEAYRQCDILVVGINEDDLVESYKHKRPLMSAKDRAEIVAKLKFVTATYIADTLERGKANNWINEQFGSPIDAVFIGSDWQGQDLHNEEGLNIEFTFRNPEKMKTRSSSYYREMLKKCGKAED